MMHPKEFYTLAKMDRISFIKGQINVVETLIKNNDKIIEERKNYPRWEKGYNNGVWDVLQGNKKWYTKELDGLKSNLIKALEENDDKGE